MERIEGVVEEIIYDNEENGYKVCCVKTGDTETVVKGILPFLNVGESIVAEGSWETHSVYGLQFSVKNYEKQLPSDLAGIKAFLASGLIQGIGPGLAGLIVDRFGADTFQVILFEPERLKSVRGITEKKVAKICEAFKTHKESSEAVMFFSRFGVGTALALKVYRMYGADTVRIASENPYLLAETVNGITFRTADRIAMELGFPEYHEERVQSCMLYVLSLAYGEGHVSLPEEVLYSSLTRLIPCGELLFRSALAALLARKKIRVCMQNQVCMIYPDYMFEAERYIEKRLAELSSQRFSVSGRNVAHTISAFEKENGIRLAEKQREAVSKAGENGFLIITGGPGTGKTTIIKAIIRVLMAEGGSCLLAAPTGRAAKRMSLACGVEAKTIHRLLEIDYAAERDGEARDDRNVAFKRNENSPLKCDALIVDESSMADTLLFYHLLKAIRYGTRLILVGDKDQLPSVGPGKVLRDSIACGRFETVVLEEIYRQNASSLITLNAHRVNKGEMPELNAQEGDFFLMVRRDAAGCIATLRELCTVRLPRKYGIDPMTDLQVILPNRRGSCGSIHVNKELQNALNPPGVGKREIEVSGVIFREGDRVMQIKNNYDLMWEGLYDAALTGEGVFNGEMGVIRSIDTKNRIVSVVFDESRLVFYDSMSLRELEHSYAITVHKSQGSEFDYCLIPIVNVTPMLMTRNLLYTAITRAKKLAVILGTREDLKRMIDNDQEVLRYTGLFKLDPGGEKAAEVWLFRESLRLQEAERQETERQEEASEGTDGDGPAGTPERIAAADLAEASARAPATGLAGTLKQAPAAEAGETGDASDEDEDDEDPFE